MERGYKISQTGSRQTSLWSELVSVLPSVLPVLNLNNRLDVRREYKAYRRKKITRRAFLSLLASAVRDYDGPGVGASERKQFADPFAGWFTAPLAAELTGRRWMGSEKMLQYVEGARHRFKDCAGFSAEHKIRA